MKIIYYSPLAEITYEWFEDISRELIDCGIIILSGTHDASNAEAREVNLPNHKAIRISDWKSYKMSLQTSGNAHMIGGKFRPPDRRPQ